MLDVHNIKTEGVIGLDKAGFINIKHPLSINISEDEISNSIAIFDLCVGVSPSTKGVNMSRFITILNRYKITRWTADNLYPVLKEIEKEVQGEGVSYKINFDFMIERESPISKHKAFMPYSGEIEATLRYLDTKEEYDFKYGVTAIGKSLCPCSKLISEYSAHNQRTFVKLIVRTKVHIELKELADMIEEEVSCPIYPIVKRVDEKYMTETAYNNPKFAEDVVRGLAEKTLADDRIKYFFLSSRAEDSILPYDAYAELERWK